MIMPHLLILLYVALFAFSPIFTKSAIAGFVRVNHTHFEIDGKPYFFVGTNFWQAVNLASEGPSGNRPQLLRELDHLQNLGVNNIRIITASTGPDSQPWRVVPSLIPSIDAPNQNLLNALDFLLVQMKLRNMRAVICLNNFWSWSGGMSQYLRWTGLGPIPYPPPEPQGSWHDFQNYTQAFYSNQRAMNLSMSVAESIVKRTNVLTGVKYSDDPTIMAWELANEPRGIRNQVAFNRWIANTAAIIKSWDLNHLITTGSEGETPSPEAAGLDFTENHQSNSIDYATLHIWAQNWGWYEPDAHTSLPRAISRMANYLSNHDQKAKRLGKPMVLEEFGLARDLGSFDARSPTTQRDLYFRAVFEAVFRLAKNQGAIAGVNFWAWSGSSRPRLNGGHWHVGDPFTGDPPHEPQGWYGVYDTDASTLAIIKEFTLKASSLSE